MAKKAVLFGINYPRTKAELKGCINDVKRMRTTLMKLYGFLNQDIIVLIDTDQSYTQPTGKNIRLALDDLVKSAQPGDELYVHYSGHGTRLPAETGDIDDMDFDECICPCDMNLITDEDFKALVSQVYEGCRITIVSDSCHSGGLIEGVEEQIGESTTSHLQEQHNTPSSSVTSKSLPLPTLIDLLKEKTDNDNIDVGKLRPTVFDVFGENASPKVKKFVKVIFDKFHQDQSQDAEIKYTESSASGSLATEFLKIKLEVNDEEEYRKPVINIEVGNAEEVHAGKTKSVLPRNGILLSGCQTNETSVDANPTGNPKDAHVAFSNAIQSILKESNGKINNYDLVSKTRKSLNR